VRYPEEGRVRLVGFVVVVIGDWMGWENEDEEVEDGESGPWASSMNWTGP